MSEFADLGKVYFDYDISKAKLGDKFYESEYGTTIYGEVVTKPRKTKAYITFEAKMSDGRTVEYGGARDNHAYWPDIVKIEHWPEEQS